MKMNTPPALEYHADTERTIAEYSRAARTRWLHDSFRQTLLIAKRRAREVRVANAPLILPDCSSDMVRVPRFLRPPTFGFWGVRRVEVEVLPLDEFMGGARSQPKGVSSSWMWRAANWPF